MTRQSSAGRHGAVAAAAILATALLVAGALVVPRSALEAAGVLTPRPDTVWALNGGLPTAAAPLTLYRVDATGDARPIGRATAHNDGGHNDGGHPDGGLAISLYPSVPKAILDGRIVAAVQPSLGLLWAWSPPGARSGAERRVSELAGAFRMAMSNAMADPGFAARLAPRVRDLARQSVAEAMDDPQFQAALVESMRTIADSFGGRFVALFTGVLAEELADSIVGLGRDLMLGRRDAAERHLEGILGRAAADPRVRDFVAGAAEDFMQTEQAGHLTTALGAAVIRTLGASDALEDLVRDLLADPVVRAELRVVEAALVETGRGLIADLMLTGPDGRMNGLAALVVRRLVEEDASAPVLIVVDPGQMRRLADAGIEANAVAFPGE